MANSINDVSPEIRDFLLKRNLLFSDTVTENGLTSRASGLGTQANISELQSAVVQSAGLAGNDEFRESLILKNRYVSSDDVIAATLFNNAYNYEQIDSGYINEKNQLYIGTTDALDTIDSVLSQEGFGLDSGGISNQGDIRTTLAGRVLGASGLINETPLGIIGGEQLLLALKQRAFFNAQRELFGQVNLQPFSLLSGSDFIVPDNSITVRSTTLGRVGDIALDVTGFNLPIDIIDDKASIFNQTETDKINDINQLKEDSLIRNNALIKYTGKGQLMRLFDGINKNKYKPAYTSDGSGRTKLGSINPKEYIIESQPTLLSQDQVNPITGLKNTYEQTTFVGQTEIWDPNIKINEKDDILNKTKKLFSDSLTYRRLFDLQGVPQLGESQLTNPSSDRISKGSGVLSEDALPLPTNGRTINKENVFSRTWSSTKPYGTVSDLQKNTGLIDYKDKIRNDIEDSVLGSNGFVKISPYKVPNNENDVYEAKKFMFSIENLAWYDKLLELPKFEQGNGDPKTGTKGRIMWFPPYDIKFTDTTTVDWDSTKFIGRGEPLYTYSNTERSGTLSFKIIIDYPDYMNNSKINDNQIMASLAAGSLEYDKYFSIDEATKLSEEYNASIELQKQIVSTTPNTPDRVLFYFENDVTTINPSYEATGLNSTWLAAGYFSTLSEQLRQNKGIKIRVSGYASKSGSEDNNQLLRDGRIDSVKAYLIASLDADINVSSRFIKGTSDTVGTASGTVDSDAVKRERSAKVDFIYQAKDDEQIKNFSDVKKEKNPNNNELTTKLKRRFHREDQYFEELKKSDTVSDKIIYNNIREKIKFFHPAFHSTTPEGFNSRLTFLQQCTRQGPTGENNKSNNLAFGSPPVCILRIGDFYHTKIIINSLTFTFEPLVWDLNPEGVGVQPMIANVEMGFKFIGGSALNGPINKLQNAVSFNYFANSGVYDPRADRWIRIDNPDPEKGSIFRANTDEEKDLRKYIDEDQFIVGKPETNTGPSNDQEETAEIGGQTEETNTTISDKDILKNIAWSVKFNETGLPNSFSFIYNSGIGYDISSLSQTYTFALDIQDSDGNFLPLIAGSVGDADSGTINSAQGWSQGDYGRGTQTFRLTFKGGDVGSLRHPITDLNVEY